MGNLHKSIHVFVLSCLKFTLKHKNMHVNCHVFTPLSALQLHI